MFDQMASTTSLRKMEFLNFVNIKKDKKYNFKWRQSSNLHAK